LGVWGLGVWLWAQNPNPQSPIPNPQSPIKLKYNLNYKIYINEIYKIK